MNRSLTAIGLITVLAAGFILPAAAADTNAIQAIRDQIQALQQQLAALKGQGGTTPPSNVPEFTRTLRRGSGNPEVRQLQTFLATMVDIYPEGLITGYFGARTEDAVKRFQKKFGIDAVGVVGPQTRQKLNELARAANALTPPAPAPVMPPPPPATTTPPVLPPPPATTTPPVTPPPSPASLPNPSQLGLPIISFFGWGINYVRVSFTHDPDVYARSYAIYVRKPGDTTDTKFGPYTIASLAATTTFANGVTFTQTGSHNWEWKQYFDLGAQPEGTYQVHVIAVGDGGVESASSPGWLTTLYSPAVFDDLLQGTTYADLVRNLTVTAFPLAIRIKNTIINTYYRYTLYDGGTKVWDGGNVTQATRAGAEADFTNPNNYQFTKGNTYRIHVDTYDNDSKLDSTTKQKSNDITITYSPYGQ